MNATIAKRHSFSAAHALVHLPTWHKCHRRHGHNYVIECEVTGPLDEKGFVVDYAVLSTFFGWVDEHLDHRDLNEALRFPPTAENLSAHLRVVATTLLSLDPEVYTIRVGVSETPSTWAWA